MNTMLAGPYAMPGFESFDKFNVGQFKYCGRMSRVINKSYFSGKAGYTEIPGTRFFTLEGEDDDTGFYYCTVPFPDSREIIQNAFNTKEGKYVSKATVELFRGLKGK